MARGGARQGAGRKVGSATRKTREIADAAAENGLTPLEYMLEVMRNTNLEVPQRLDAAKSAAAYVHPRLANVQAEVSGPNGGSIPLVVQLIGPDDDDHS